MTKVYNKNELLEAVDDIGYPCELKEYTAEDKITKAKAHHKKELDMYTENIRDYINQYGSKNCDYLSHRCEMVSYHRGAWNALNELEK